MAEAVFNKEESFHQQTLDLNLTYELVKCYFWSIALYGSKISTLTKVDEKYRKGF